jgi:hypothetical protein
MNSVFIGCRTDPSIQGVLKGFDTYVPLKDETSLQDVAFRNEGIVRKLLINLEHK